jgi:uroporphyrinogen-III synthase
MSTNDESNILKDRTVICTYPQRKHDRFYEMLAQSGATVHAMPLIETTSIPFKTKRKLTDYDWLVFTSKNAVPSFVSNHPELSNKIAAIGLKTAEMLMQKGIVPTFVGSGKSSGDFADEFMAKLKGNERILLILGNLAKDTLLHKFKQKANVERVNVYETRFVQSVDPKILNLVESNQYDALIATSPSAVKALVEKIKISPKQLRFISIGKTTTAAINEYQAVALATAKKTSYLGLAETTIQYLKSNKTTIKD